MDQSFMHFAIGVGVGVLLTTVVGLGRRAYQFVKAVEATRSHFGLDEPFNHHDLYEVAQSNSVVSLLDYQAGELCDEFANIKEQMETLEQHLDEAMTRNTELHKEVYSMARVANNLQDQVGRGQIEIDHCHACCDELRAKLDSNNVVAVEVKGVTDFADAVHETGELSSTDADWLKSFAIEYTYNVHVCEPSNKVGA